MGKEMSRRSFLKTGTAAAIGLSMTPGSLFAGVDAQKKKRFRERFQGSHWQPYRESC